MSEEEILKMVRSEARVGLKCAGCGYEKEGESC